MSTKPLPDPNWVRTDARFGCRLDEFLAYYLDSVEIGDVTHQESILRFIADRLALDTEARLWLAWLYAATYSPGTALLCWASFPELAGTNPKEFDTWWCQYGQYVAVFQNERRFMKLQDRFRRNYFAYRRWIGTARQEDKVRGLISDDPAETNQRIHLATRWQMEWSWYAAFLWAGAVKSLAGLPLEFTRIDWDRAITMRNGLFYAWGMDDWVRVKDVEPLPDGWRLRADELFTELLRRARAQRPDLPIDIVNLELALCSYRKFKFRTRYPGYYLDRVHDEIVTLQRRAPDAFDWTMLWEARRALVQPRYLVECSTENREFWRNYHLNLPPRTEPIYEHRVTQWGAHPQDRTRCELVVGGAPSN